MILDYDFEYNNTDKCMYSKFIEKCGVIIYLYIDDMLIVGTNMDVVNEDMVGVTRLLLV